MFSKSSSLHERQQQIPVLVKGSSFELWTIKMKTLLKSEGLLDFVETGYDQASDHDRLKENEKQDAKALFFIQQAVDESVFSRIADATSAKQAWSLLKNIYLESNKVFKPTSLKTDNITVQSLYECLEKGKSQTTRQDSSPSIRMIPSTIRDRNESCYTPRIVSIGPLHKEDENLQAKEGEKASHVHRFLSRFERLFTREQLLQICVYEVTSKIDEIRSCYAEKIIYTNIELAKMMVMDACFILEFLYCIEIGEFKRFGNGTAQLTVYDLLLVENQIPFFVLQDIFNFTISRFDQPAPAPSLIDMIHTILVGATPFPKENLKRSSNPNPPHIIDMMHEYYRRYPQFKPQFEPGSYPESKLPSAAELDRASVDFKPIKDTDWPLAMEVKSRRLPCCPSFAWGRPALVMPVLTIDDFTELLLRNLIAYEQFSENVPHYITSYAGVMDMLIDTEEDIARMVGSKVLVNHTGSNQEAADIINRICKEVFLTECYYAKQLEQLIEHYNGSWGKNIASLRRNYFNSPWNIIALIAGIILFALTVVQTIFTVKSTDKSNSKIGKIWK